ncbi:MAG: shikimate kinase [Phycisphaerales bacterium]|nr:shikimate kinase [Phycisphaerales bacterium]
MSGADPNLVLIGLRASGKSTLGARAAELLGRSFVDLDERSAAVLGAPGAGEAIAEHGMEAFRGAEREALAEVLKTPGQVVSLGGGTPTAAGCVELLSGDGQRVLYLKAQPDTLRERLASSDNSDRPSLTGRGVIDEVAGVYEERDPLYMEIAESVIHTDGVGEDAVVAMIVALAKAGV